MVKTPDEKWKKTVAGYRKKCQTILDISENIRYAGAINSYGRTLTGIIKPDVKPMLGREQAKNEFFIIPTMLTLRGESSKKLGKMNYTLVHHQKITILVLQKDTITYYTTIDKKEKDIDKIISGIQKII